MSKETKEHWREEQAKREIGVTDISRPAAIAVSVLFLAVICSVAFLQTAIGLHERRPGLPGKLSFWGQFDGAGRDMAKAWSGASTALRRFLEPNAVLLERIKAFEKELDDTCFLTEWTAGPVQEWLCRLGAGNEKAYVGRDGWLFYEAGVRYITGPGFLDPAQLKARSAEGNEYLDPPQPDPVRAIVNFRDQLRARGIELIVVPAPGKATIHPEKFTSRLGPDIGPAQNVSYSDFLEKLNEAGVHVFDCASLLMEAKKKGGEQYLATDTHWRPEIMEMVAEKLKDFIRAEVELPEVREAGYKRVDERVSNLGDITVMLKLPKSQKLYSPEHAVVHSVFNVRGEFWRPSRDADVLVLGDSFSNIYSDKTMNWGQAAGFIEQLSFYLQRPLDRLAQNDAGSHATRSRLMQKLNGGYDRLAGKKLVVWEFAARELAVGDWKLFKMPSKEEIEQNRIARESQTTFVVCPKGEQIKIGGTVDSISPVPRPGSVPYKDHVVTVHLVNVEGVDRAVEGNQAIVYMWSMRDNVLTPAARHREGDRLELTLKSWTDVAEEYEAINRSDLDDENLQIQEPNWGEEEGEKKIREAVQKTAAAAAVAAAVTATAPLPSEAEESSFMAECAAKAAEAEKAGEIAVEGRDGWKFLGKELRHVSVGKFWGDEAANVSRASKPEWADPVPAIVDFHEQLAKAGIELILVPVPPKVVVYPDMLVERASPEPRHDVYHQEFYKLLGEKGIRVIDLAGMFIAARNETDPPLYCKTDTHYSPRACEIIAGLVKKEIGEPEWLAGTASEGFETEAATRDINGDLGGSETLKVRVVRGKAGGPTTDRSSPVLLLGDSHCLVFSSGGDMHGAQTGLADQLAAELGIPVDLLGVRGSGATPARLSLMRRAADDSYMAGKKVVVWCFTAREFTEAQGWRKVPVIR